MKVVLERRKDIAFYIKFYPIKKETEEQIKSIACRRSLSMLEDAYANKNVAAQDCAKNVKINEMVELAKSLGIRAVPALIMPDGRIHSGYTSADNLIEIINGK